MGIGFIMAGGDAVYQCLCYGYKIIIIIVFILPHKIQIRYLVEKSDECVPSKNCLMLLSSQQPQNKLQKQNLRIQTDIQIIFSASIAIKIISVQEDINKNLMNKNSLPNIILQKSLQRQNLQKSSKSIPFQQQKINSKIQFPQMIESVTQSNKMIKITQFNSSLVINDDKISQKGYKSSTSNSPHKNFNIKKMNELKNKAIVNTQKIIEIQLKRKDIPPFRKKYVQDIDVNEQVQKLLITSKWSLRSQFLNNEQTTSNNRLPQTVIVIKPQERRPNSNERSMNHLQLSDNVLIGKCKNIQPKDTTKISSSKEKSRPKLNAQQVFIGTVDADSLIRKYSASPRKNYSKHLEQQKRYQENIEKQKKELLEIKRQLNKNYAKPFNPPQNVTAFSYIVYEADLKRNKKLRKYSARRQQAQQMTQIRKIFLHSHQVIVSLNSRTAVEIASLTKIMTCIVGLDIAKKYNLNLNEQIVTIGLFEQNIGGTSANIKKGQIYTIWQLLHGLMLPSGNDASLAIAVWGGRVLIERQGRKKDNESSSLTISTNNLEEKSRPRIKKKDYYERFINQMNLKANELSMEKTKYCNSHGLSNPQNRSCAFDLAIVSQYAMNNIDFRQIVSCKTFQAQIKIQSTQIQKQKLQTKDSKKLLKKKSNTNDNRQGLMELEEMKDMDGQMFQDKFIEQEQTNNEQPYQKTEIKYVKWQNTHQLLQQKSDLYIGMKTGITNTAGPCLASCIQIKGRRFIIVVLNCKNMIYRMKDTQNLRRWLFGKECIKYHERNAEKVIDQQNNS